MKNLKSALPLLLFPLQSIAVETTTAAKQVSPNWIGLSLIALILCTFVGFFTYMIVTQDDKQKPPKQED